ncbi:ribonuclease III domain-containing protein [Sparassis latifolia]
MKSSLHPTIQDSILQAIRHPQFNASLPPLSDDTWARLLSPSSQARAENERLEFLGDALMYATIGRQLYGQIPDGSPHLYTALRAALHSNATFSHLAERLDILAVNSSVLEALTYRTFGEGTSAPSKSRTQIKATADLFETLIGAYYLDRGFEALCDWVRDLYTPLIVTAKETFYKWQTATGRMKRLRRSPISDRVAKRFRGNTILEEEKKSIRINHGFIPSVYTSVSSSDVMSVGVSSNAILIPNAANSSTPIIVGGLSGSSGQTRHTKSAFKPVVIDLTASPDSNDDERCVSAKTPVRSRISLPLPRRRLPSGYHTALPTVVRRDPPKYVVIDSDDPDGSTSSADEYMLERMLIVDDTDGEGSRLTDEESDMTTDNAKGT